MLNNERYTLKDAQYTPKEEIENKIFAECLKLLNKNLRLSLPSNILISLIVFIGLQQDINPIWLNSWFAAVLIISVLRGFFCFLNHSTLSVQLQYKLLLIGTGLSASLWGILGSALMPNGDLLHQMLVILIIIGVASGGLHTLQASAKVNCLFLSLSILPMNAWFFFQDTFTHFSLGIALFLYFSFMIMVSLRSYRLLHYNLTLTYNNLNLIKKLSTTNNVLEESESRFHAAFDFAAIGMAIVSLDGQFLKVNKSLCQITGYTEDELLKTDFQAITYKEDLETDLNYARQLLAGEINSYQLEKRYIHKNGNLIWILLSGSLIRNSENSPLYFIAQIQNIDLQKNAEQELKYIALHDVLTGLANRKQLEISFEYALTYAKRHQTRIAVLFIDLDYFKDINDNYGHDIGDSLLKEIASRLKAAFRASDILVRLGGDEFMLVLTEITNSTQAENVAKKILTIIGKPMKIDNHKLSITGSIGMSIFPEDGQDLSTLMKHADKALYFVKSEGRNNFKMFMHEHC